MRLAACAFAIVSCAACFPYDSSEYVPITVRVYHGDGELGVALGARVSDDNDPCDAPAPDIAACTPIATVRIRDLALDPRCYFDTKISNGEIGRVMQCPAGAMVVFEHTTFVGARSSPRGFVDACSSTTYDFPQGDTCTWRTEQRIQGSLTGPLSFSYSESPIAPSAATREVGAGACTLACRAHATLDVLP